MNIRIPVLLLAAGMAHTAAAQVLAEWVENDPGNDPNKLALGYPVPGDFDLHVAALRRAHLRNAGAGDPDKRRHSRT